MAEEVKTSKARNEVEKKPMVSDLDQIRSKIRIRENVCAVSVCHFGRTEAFTYVHGPLSFRRIYAENLVTAILGAVCEGSTGFIGSSPSKQIESRPEHHR